VGRAQVNLTRTYSTTEFLFVIERVKVESKTELLGFTDDFLLLASPVFQDELPGVASVGPFRSQPQRGRGREGRDTKNETLELSSIAKR
jgi:hypothetical protein